MFYDESRVYLAAGNGGDGCFSMHRARYIPKGGPDGGDGGKGGDLILVGDTNTGDLRDYHFKQEWGAGNGEPGRGRNQTGAGGANRELKLPLGTQVVDDETGELCAEILEHGQRLRLLRGGAGGRGNAFFKSPTDQAPRQSTPGEPGETGTYRFVLKTIADVGLVGYPNAGKSTLIGMLTEASPKTAAYPFTTLNPTVGVLEYPEYYDRLTLADIPGLIEGASENRGLGHRFLRHIERCPLLLFVLDMAGTDGRNPADDFQSLIQELRAYLPELVERPRMLAANKMDEPCAEENLKDLRAMADKGESILPISCLSDDGMPALREALYREVVRQRKLQQNTHE